MRIISRLAAASLALALLTACGGSDAGNAAATDGESSAMLENLPVTLEGILITGIEEIDDGSDISGMDVHGTLFVGDDMHQVKVAVPLVRSLNLAEDGSKVRATLGSTVVENGETLYIVTSAERI